MKDSTVNYGILAVSSMSPRFARAAELSSFATVKAIASRSLEKAEEFRKEHGLAKAYGDYHQLLQDPDIEAVYIPVINALHYQYALDSLNAGKHVILEKPFTVDSAHARHLQEVAREKGLFIAEAVKTLCLPIYDEIRQILKEETIGKMMYLEFRQSHVNSPYSQGWNKEKSLGGGRLWGHESYYLSVAEMLAGKISELSGSAQYENGVDVQFAVSGLTASGVPAVCLLSSKTRFPFNGLIIYGERGRIVIPDYWKASKAEVWVNNELVKTLEYPCKWELIYEIDHFSQCIRKGLNESPLIPLADTVRHTELVERLYQKWESR